MFSQIAPWSELCHVVSAFFMHFYGPKPLRESVMKEVRKENVGASSSYSAVCYWFVASYRPHRIVHIVSSTWSLAGLNYFVLWVCPWRVFKSLGTEKALVKEVGKGRSSQKFLRLGYFLLICRFVSTTV